MTALRERPLRGMVVEVDLEPVIGHEQGRSRPCVVLQNDIGNRYSSTSIIAPLTKSSNIRHGSPIYVHVAKGDGGARYDSVVLCDQIRTVDQRRFRGFYGTLSIKTMRAVEDALRLSLGL